MISQSYSLQHLAQFVQGEVCGDEHYVIQGLASLEQASQSKICFVNADKYIEAAKQSQAGAFIVNAELKTLLPEKQNFIVVANPYLAFAQLTHLFERKTTARGIEPTAIVHASAQIGADVYIGHYVVIGEHCVIGANTTIESHSKIEAGVAIGEHCFIDSHVTILGQSQIQNHVRIHSNTVIGAEGFGFAPYAGRWHRIAQLGSVQIGNHVRIGSNCSIDRGALDDTIIEDGVIIDNLVQIAHNVHIGANTAIAAKTGIAGSTKVGQNCVLAGACGIAGHLTIADNVTLTGMAMVTKNISEAGTYSSGTGLFDNHQWKRTIVRFRQLADVPLAQLVKKLEQLQQQVESLETHFKQRK